MKDDFGWKHISKEEKRKLILRLAFYLNFADNIKRDDIKEEWRNA